MFCEDSFQATRVMFCFCSRVSHTTPVPCMCRTIEYHYEYRLILSRKTCVVHFFVFCSFFFFFFLFSHQWSSQHCYKCVEMVAFHWMKTGSCLTELHWLLSHLKIRMQKWHKKPLHSSKTCTASFSRYLDTLLLAVVRAIKCKGLLV